MCTNVVPIVLLGKYGFFLELPNFIEFSLFAFSCSGNPHFSNLQRKPKFSWKIGELHVKKSGVASQCLTEEREQVLVWVIAWFEGSRNWNSTLHVPGFARTLKVLEFENQNSRPWKSVKSTLFWSLKDLEICCLTIFTSWKNQKRLRLEQIWQLSLKPDHLVSHFNGIFY